MCLETIVKISPTNKTKKKTGWKWMRKSPYQQGVVIAPYRKTAYRVGINCVSDSVDLTSNMGYSYPSGFHIYEKIEDAIRYCWDGFVCKIEYSNIKCIGKNDRRDKGRTAVAGQMKILAVYAVSTARKELTKINKQRKIWREAKAKYKTQK